MKVVKLYICEVCEILSKSFLKIMTHKISIQHIKNKKAIKH